MSYEEKKDEQELWAEMDPMAWHYSIAGESIFTETYELTRLQILDAAKQGGHDVIIEVGSGTGDVIGEMETSIPRYGFDINSRFIDHCKAHHETDDCKFIELDVLQLSNWWSSQFAGRYQKPLVVCVNNTLNIMPEELRAKVVSEMIAVAGKDGRCVVSYWNGNFFSHAIMNYYMLNSDLCGKFDMTHVSWGDRVLHTPTGYSTCWMLPHEVQKLMRSFDINVDIIGDGIMHGRDHINTAALAIFVWFSESCTSRSKTYYDSDDAQKFYSKVWGDETIHIGRYDLLTEAETSSLPKSQQIARAEELHEIEFVKLINSTFQVDEDTPKMRILDMGCGYGGLLRRLWKNGNVWSAVGADISFKMCAQARRLNGEIGANMDISIREESYLDVSVANESMDLIISMDALLHVGPDGQQKAIQEAARILRPGGWMIFSDIMQQEVVDPTEMQPIYDRIHLSKMGTVSNYEESMKQVGFTKFSFTPFSENVSVHYGTVREVLLETKDNIDVSADFLSRMEGGLATWKELAPKNIRWGFLVAQKTEKLLN